MAVEFFLIDAPHAVPAEFAAWVAAKERHREVFLQVLDGRALEASAVAAAAEADRLEQVARQAWARSLPS